MLARDLIRAGYLDADEARVLSRVLLAGQVDSAQLRATFAGLGGYQEPACTLVVSDCAEDLMIESSR